MGTCGAILQPIDSRTETHNSQLTHTHLQHSRPSGPAILPAAYGQQLNSSTEHYAKTNHTRMNRQPTGQHVLGSRRNNTAGTSSTSGILQFLPLTHLILRLYRTGNVHITASVRITVGLKAAPSSGFRHSPLPIGFGAQHAAYHQMNLSYNCRHCSM
ncbi:hypothetical protein Tcan_12047 [Toxocara canis]|uniref:Uncharacterized protein n=1 Tax=Toxocara canis TaxID=6265 RepID=A0A0B2UPR4_TOXCA|nr:hypothetical protein Tcan_12047 [Toxocara canis]